MQTQKIKITFLGTGTSSGIPMICCPCEVCHSSNTKDKRLRSSILVESTTLSQEQQQLWRNIQHALQAEYHVLQWPFALEVLQDGIGVENYVQGFVDVLSTDKNMLILGQLPHFKSEQCLHLASLQEMLDQPLLKKSLWDAIQITSLQPKA